MFRYNTKKQIWNKLEIEKAIGMVRSRFFNVLFTQKPSGLKSPKFLNLPFPHFAFKEIGVSGFHVHYYAMLKKNEAKAIAQEWDIYYKYFYEPNTAKALNYVRKQLSRNTLLIEEPYTWVQKRINIRELLSPKFAIDGNELHIGQSLVSRSFVNEIPNRGIKSRIIAIGGNPNLEMNSYCVIKYIIRGLPIYAYYFLTDVDLILCKTLIESKEGRIQSVCKYPKNVPKWIIFHEHVDRIIKFGTVGEILFTQYRKKEKCLRQLLKTQFGISGKNMDLRKFDGVFKTDLPKKEIYVLCRQANIKCSIRNDLVFVDDAKHFEMFFDFGKRQRLSKKEIKSLYFVKQLEAL